MFLAFLTFVVVTAMFLALIGLVLYRIANHLRGNDEATKSVVQHVLIPLLGRKRIEEPEQEDAEVEEIKPVVPEPKTAAKEVF